ncbi:hypothetical protein [Paraburkholderia kirstenboschensis]|uniref:Uncharacterized protein n=1 Tax=Paraburkholderia kirstenboschensis TaxID=1245436 RepID=A0ABZ0EB17_9BURK|nr:hypothetical protein [Paraburkholderia kirstenboschensis]WOD13387.1 hypothetical protein RW095_04925 [Paraburkholderia kirstenboschensis]
MAYGAYARSHEDGAQAHQHRIIGTKQGLSISQKVACSRHLQLSGSDRADEAVVCKKLESPARTGLRCERLIKILCTKTLMIALSSIYSQLREAL